MFTLGNVSTALAILATLIGFWKLRRDELRHSDVHAWAVSSIATVQRSLLIMRAAEETYGARDDKLDHLGQDISVLIEQGRLCFRNIPGTGDLRGFGAEKAPAYRGMRPVVLDDLVRVCEAIAAWQVGTYNRRQIIAAVEYSRASFVSMMQAEVGRSRTRSKNSVLMGVGSPLDNFIERR